MDIAALLLGLVVGAAVAAAIAWALWRGIRPQPAWSGEDTAQALDQLRDHLIALDRDRAQAHGELRTQVLQMGETSQALRAETAALVTALRAPHVRGQWGEMQLRRVVELSGMLAHCDFVEQPEFTDVDGRHRPDMLIQLTAGRQIIVDAKVPLAAFLDAVNAADEPGRLLGMTAHARQLRQHIDNLATRDYLAHVPGTPEFVVLFLPSDAFLAAALETEPALLEYGFTRDVVIATPATLLALLRTVAHTWRQEVLAANTAQVLELGRILHGRLVRFSEHLGRLGAALGSAVGRYNETVGSYERSVLVSARRFSELGVNDNAIPAPDDIRTPLRGMVVDPFRRIDPRVDPADLPGTRKDGTGYPT
ncbi:MAG: DNA recombination protein RmuC [Actinomycetota bacterium]|nr:DNA recombination protein RmuC [Actinomycetota bacterium]